MTTDDVALARQAVAQIDRRSVVQEPWDDGGRNEEWHADVAELLARLEV